MSFIDKDNLTIVKRNKKGSSKIEAKVIAIIKLTVESGEAKPVAPIAPVLGQFQINSMEFCKRFNALTINYELGLPMEVIVYKKSDANFDIKIKPPLFNFLLWIMQNEGETNEIKSEE